MSGAEAITAVQLLGACIDIVKTIIDIGRAAHDAQGLPPKLRSLFKQLPAIEGPLKSAQDNINKKGLDENTRKNIQPILKDCKETLDDLKEILDKACPNANDTRGKRIWKGAKTAFRETQVKKLLASVQENLRILEQNKICQIGDQLDALQEVTEALAENDESGKYQNWGDGPQVANEGGNATNYFGGYGSSRQINNPGVYNESSSTYTYHYLPPARPETPPMPSCNIQYRRNPYFVERPELTNRVRNLLSVKGGRAALVGLGGVGKSQLAIQYSHQVHEESPETWVFWIHASNVTRFEQSLHHLAEAAKIRGRHEAKTQIYQLVWAWLQDAKGGKKWIVVLDNADDASILLQSPVEDEDGKGRRRIDYIPICDHGSVLLTSRSSGEARKIVEHADLVLVRTLDKDDAVSLLQKKLGMEQGKDDMEKLAEALDCLPLALTQAASYILQRGARYTVKRYLAKLAKSDQWRTGILNEALEDHQRDREAQNVTLKTWQISFDHMSTQRPSAAELLGVMSFCDRRAIPETLIRPRQDSTVMCPPRMSYDRTTRLTDLDWARDSDFEANDGNSSDHSVAASSMDEAFDMDVATLEGYSFLIASQADCCTFEMHRLVQYATKQWLLSRGVLEGHSDIFIDRLRGAFPAYAVEKSTICQKLFPHAKLAVYHRPLEKVALLQWADIMHWAAYHAMTQDNMTDAESMAFLGLDIRQKELGEYDVRTIEGISLTGRILGRLRRYREAEEMYLQALAASEELSERESHIKLALLNDIGMILKDQEKYEAAGEIFWRRLDYTENMFGTRHPKTTFAFSSMTNLYSIQKKWKEVVRACQDVRVNWIVQGDSSEMVNVDMLDIMNDLASACEQQGDLDNAVKLQLKRLQCSRKVLGPQSADSFDSAKSLARIYLAQGRLEESKAFEAEVVNAQQHISCSGDVGTMHNISRLAAIRAMQDSLKEMVQPWQGVESESEEVNVTHDLTAQHFESCWRLQRQVCEGNCK